MEHILLIDTSADKCTTGLSEGEQLLKVLQHTERQSQAAVINPLIDQLCNETRVSLDQLSAVAVCSGPGSYTGLRIGLAAAKGIAYALNKPLILHNKLELLAWQQIQSNPGFAQYGVLITARQNEFFFAVYDAQMDTLQLPIHGTTENISALLNDLNTDLFLSGDQIAVDTFGLHISLCSEIDFEVWSAYAVAGLKNRTFADIASSVPFYMKEVFIYAPRNRGLQS